MLNECERAISNPVTLTVMNVKWTERSFHPILVLHVCSSIKLNALPQKSSITSFLELHLTALIGK